MANCLKMCCKAVTICHSEKVNFSERTSGRSDTTDPRLIHCSSMFINSRLRARRNYGAFSAMAKLKNQRVAIL
jgi:hypothetical protein